MPGVTRSKLEAEAHTRYEPGKGPWSKDDDLDQVDLVRFEELAQSFNIYSDPRGLLAGCIDRLVDEVRRARGWPKPASLSGT